MFLLENNFWEKKIPWKNNWKKTPCKSFPFSKIVPFLQIDIMPVGVYAEVRRESVCEVEKGTRNPRKRERERGRETSSAERSWHRWIVLTLKGTAKVSRRTKSDEDTPKGIFRRRIKKFWNVFLEYWSPVKVISLVK